MNVFNNCLKISSIINFILGGLFFIVTPIYGLILIGLAFLLLFLSQDNIESLRNKKGLILFLGIISVFTNIVSSILIFVGYGYLLAELKKNVGEESIKRKEIDKEKKKIDLLLKLGTFMIFISGISFITTNWYEVSNIFKIGFLFVFGTIFLIISFIINKKLNIKETTFTYWILGLSFYFFTWIGICYFEVFGNLLSYQGVLKDFAYFTTVLLFTLFTLLTSIRFEMKNLVYLVYIGLYISIFYLLKYIGISSINIILFLTVINTISSVILKKNKTYLKDLFKAISFMMIFILFKSYSKTFDISLLIVCFLNILNILILLFKNNDSLDNIVGFILIYIYLYLSIINQSIINDTYFLFVSVISIISILVKIFKGDNKIFYTINQVVYNISVIVFWLLESEANENMIVLVSAIYFFTSLVNGLNMTKSNKKSLDYYLQPISLLTLVISSLYMIDKYYINISFTTGFGILSLIYVLLSFITRNKLKEEYFVFGLFSIILSGIVNAFEQELIAQVIISLGALGLFIKTYFDKNNKDTLPVIYVLLLLNMDLLFVSLHINIIYSSLLTILLYIALLLIFRKRRSLEITTDLLITLPVYQTFLDTASYEMTSIIENILQLYILYLIIKFFFKNTNAKGIISLIGIVLIISQIIFESGEYIGIYVGIVGVIIIILGYVNNSYKYLFHTGFIITIVNILCQLNNIWGSIPFWLYLLLIGLGLIGFVTYNELKKNKE